MTPRRLQARLKWTLLVAVLPLAVAAGLLVSTPSVGAAAVLPSDVVKLSGWNLTLPVAAPGATDARKVGQPQLLTFASPPSFMLNAAHNAVLLRAYTTGARLARTNFARSELRELSSSGALAAWTSGGVNTLTARQAITHLPSASPTAVIAGVRSGTANVVQIVADARGRTAGTASLCVRFKSTLQSACLDNSYALGAAYNLNITLSGGAITVSYNGVAKLRLVYTGTKLSFFAGTDLQTRAGTDAAAYAESALSALTAVHSASPAPTTTAPTTTAPTTTAPTTTAPTSTPPGARWTPTPRVQWQWQLSSTPTAADLTTAYASGARAFDIDGEGASAADVAAIHKLGSDVGAVCYIEVGGWEDYRSDAGSFPASVSGDAIDGWPGEKWLDVRQVAILMPIMRARVQMCASKGFDAVEPDLMDGYENTTGFPITAAQQITYNIMIAGLAHAAGLSVTQKGDVDQSAALQPYFDWTLNEQCGQYAECGALSSYTSANKAVWIAEYTGMPGVCATDFPIAGPAAMGKNVNLTAPRTPCLSTKG